MRYRGGEGPRSAFLPLLLFGSAALEAQRTREIGVRIALGAETRTVAVMVLRWSLILAGAGVGTGVVAAFGVTRLMSALLYGVSPTDPITFITVPVVLTATALMASYLPARRAAKTDPVEALRAE